ncbi:MAG: helix-turn-helix transcriptional regulator [Phycisphaeraceae bacterium]|nr:helix-turn-helix transcriptional regulator [Phycisphaeraceae bacterium]
MKIEREMMRGAGPVAVMKLLSNGERYGYELVEQLARQTAGVLEMGQSTLYPMLYNLEGKGWIRSRTDDSGPRPRKYYSLTSKGRKQLADDTKRWAALIEAMGSLGIGTRRATGGAA